MTAFPVARDMTKNEWLHKRHSYYTEKSMALRKTAVRERSKHTIYVIEGGLIDQGFLILQVIAAWDRTRACAEVHAGAAQASGGDT